MFDELLHPSACFQGNPAQRRTWNQAEEMTSDRVARTSTSGCSIQFSSSRASSDICSKPDWVLGTPLHQIHAVELSKQLTTAQPMDHHCHMPY